MSNTTRAEHRAADNPPAGEGTVTEAETAPMVAVQELDTGPAGSYASTWR